MSEELKPCPFCGGKAVLLGGPQAQECHSVWCLECSAKMQGGMQSEPLVEKWNARPAPAVQVPEGMALVPVEPTPEMLAAAAPFPEHLRLRHPDDKTWEARMQAATAGDQMVAAQTYRKMLAAAPAAPAARESGAQEILAAYDAGFRRACDWARRDDMLHDLESFAYTQDRACDLERLGMAWKDNMPAAQGGGVDVEKVMALVRDYGHKCAEYGCYGPDLENIRAILASAPAVPVGDGCDSEVIAQFLYGLLDDIDTASDMAKSDDSAYRKLVERIQARKREVVAECDGYTVKFKTPAPAATKEQEHE